MTKRKKPARKSPGASRKTKRFRIAVSLSGEIEFLISARNMDEACRIAENHVGMISCSKFDDAIEDCIEPGLEAEILDAIDLDEEDADER